MISEAKVWQAIATLFSTWDTTLIQWPNIPFTNQDLDNFIRVQVLTQNPKAAPPGSEWDNALLQVSLFYYKLTAQNLYGAQVIVDEIKQPEPGQDRKIYERQMLMNFRAKVNNNSFQKDIEKKADIVDNRVMFY